jgi:hypothetical protein
MVIHYVRRVYREGDIQSACGYCMPPTDMALTTEPAEASCARCLASMATRGELKRGDEDA